MLKIWGAMIRGDYDLVGQEFYFYLFLFVIVTISNVILLSLINAILGDAYEEISTSIEEKCLKDYNYNHIRYQAFNFKNPQNFYHFAFIECDS